MDDIRGKQHVVEILVKLLLELLTQERLTDFAKYLITYVENLAKSTENKYDDIIITGLCNKVKDVFGLNS